MTGVERPQVRRLTPDDWAVLRDVRIAALTDAPEAFGSTLERELSFSEADWRGRLRDDSQRGYVQFVAMLDDDVAGTIGLMRNSDRPEVAEMVSMWVAPKARGRGVGDRLVLAFVDTARDKGYTEAELWVADGNHYAERLYERNGFRRTGAVQPIRADEPERLEFAMARRSAEAGARLA